MKRLVGSLGPRVSLAGAAPARRESLRSAVRRLLRDEALALLTLWIAVMVPVACQQGPMALFFFGDHEHHLAIGHEVLHHQAALSPLPGTDGASPTAPASAPQQMRPDDESTPAFAIAFGSVALPAAALLLLALSAAAVSLRAHRPPAAGALPPPDQPPRPSLLVA